MENMDLLWLTVNNKLGKMKLVANGRIFFFRPTRMDELDLGFLPFEDE